MNIYKSLLSVVLIAVSQLVFSASQGGQTIFDRFDNLMQSYVNESGLVDYNGIRSNTALLNGLIKDIEAFSVENKSQAEVKAFYINAYNTLVIKQLADNPKLNSPLKLSGFFDKNKFTVAGESLTLNELEKEKILKVYDDPRVHFVLVCGALGCPPLLNKAYLPATMESVIKQRTVKALNSDFIKVNKKGLGLSKIFEWYEKDFSDNGMKGVVAYINQYRTTPLDPKSKISFYEYDWTINAQ